LEAISCESALDVFETTLPDCCLVDYRLPLKSGLDFLKALRSKEIWANIPVIMMTGEGDEKIAVEMMRNGAQDYLVKGDITADKLRNSISSAMRTCELQHKLQYLAHYDTLTGLLNRALFMDRLQTSISHCDRYQQACSLLYIDVDNFKHINDSYGHDAGDEVLRTIARRIKENCRTTDSAARLGGDEFAVLLDRINEGNTNLTAEKILLAVSQPLYLSKQKVQVTLSIGVAHYPKTANNLEEFLKQADEAMYYAKQSGKAGYIRFSNEHRQDWDRRHQLEIMLPIALKNNELCLAYQPIVNASDQSLHGLEVLARWSPEGFTVSATELVGMIERLGLFDPFHVWLINTALCQCAQWQAISGDMQFCLNIPATHSHSEWLVHCLHKAFATYDIKPFQVSLEITETTLMSDPELSNKLLTSLQEEGVQIAIDDFGAGYSSMSYLTTLPLNVLKIDQQFIKNMDNDHRSRKVVEAITALGHSLGLKVVAEGIETESQYHIAREIGCDLLQGYYFGRPGFGVEKWGDFIGKYPSILHPQGVSVSGVNA
jgi:diguanylate cyclase